MSLRDELSDLSYQQISQDPVGRVYLDGGEAAVLAGGYDVTDVVRLVQLLLDVRREQIFVLADEIDALKQSS